MILLLAFLLVLLSAPSLQSSSKSCSNSTSHDTLVMAQVIFRHGARNIDRAIGNDRWSAEKYWTGGFKQLTNQGKLQQYKLGKYFRKRYQEKLFPHGYSPNKVYVRSSSYDRTIASADANLAGLFPPTKKQTWNKDFPWQPIPVHPIPFEEDTMLFPLSNPCPLHEQYFEEYTAPFTAKHEELRRYCSEHIGQNLTSDSDIAYLYDNFKVEREQNKSIPCWEKKVDSQMYDVYIYFIQSFTATPEMARLRGGFLIKEILDNFTNKTQSLLNSDRTFLMYSAHDLTIVSVLNTLRMWDGLQPPYAASLIFELHESNGEYYIQMLYRKSPKQCVEILEIPNCGTKCNLQRFQEIYQDVIPTQDYETECKIPN